MRLFGKKKNVLNKVIVSDLRTVYAGCDETDGSLARYCVYTRQKNGRFELRHRFSTTQVYCSICGEFGHFDGKNLCKPTYLSEQEMKEMLNGFEPRKKFFMDMFYSDGTTERKEVV
jgi:hypothetical protein